jgi:PQQ enzyme repeat
MTQSSGLSEMGPPWSTLTAYDLNSGTIRWQVPNGGVTALERDGHTGTGARDPRGGPVVTAGCLIFAATASDHKVRAWDEDTGKHFPLPAAMVLIREAAYLVLALPKARYSVVSLTVYWAARYNSTRRHIMHAFLNDCRQSSIMTIYKDLFEPTTLDPTNSELRVHATAPRWCRL